MYRKIKYLLAKLHWILKGRPVRTKKEIEYIYNEICKPCEYFEEESVVTGSCGVCGCALASSKLIKHNKLLWATTKCPIGKWK